METETKSYNFTEKRAIQLEKARQKRWELHNKEKSEPQEEEKQPEVEPEKEEPVVETPPPEPPKKEEPPEPVRPPSPEPVRPPSPPPPVVEKASFQYTRNGTLLFYDE